MRPDLDSPPVTEAARAEMEAFHSAVVEEVRRLAGDKALLGRVLAEAQSVVRADLDALTEERDGLRAEIDRHHRELRSLAGSDTPRTAELHERIAGAERRLPELAARIAEIERESITRAEAEAAFADFDALWQGLSPREQQRLIRLLVASVEYDGQSVAVTFRPTSIRALIVRRLENAA